MCPVQAKNTEKQTREHSRLVLNFPGEQSYPEGRSQGQGTSSAIKVGLMSEDNFIL